MEKQVLRKDSVLGRRIGAFITDHLVITIIAMIPFLIYFNKLIKDFNYFYKIFTIIMIIGIVGYLIKDVFFGRSIGKLLFGLYVRRENDIEKIPRIHLLLARNLLTLIWPIEFLVMLIDNDGKRLGDKLAKTQVIGYKNKLVFRVITAGVLAFAIFVTTLIIGVTQIIRNDASFKTAVQYIEKQEGVKSIVGEIEGYGNFPLGSISANNDYGDAELSIKVKGKIKDLVVKVQLTKNPGSEWIVQCIDY